MVFNSTRCVFFCNEVKDRKIFQIASPENRKPLKKTKKETASDETASRYVSCPGLLHHAAHSAGRHCRSRFFFRYVGKHALGRKEHSCY